MGNLLNKSRIIDMRFGLSSNNGEYPINFKECLFKIQISTPTIYLKEFQKKLEQYELNEYDFRTSSQVELSTEIKNDLKELQLKMEEEGKLNMKEIERTNGGSICYGDSINLVHIPTDLYIGISREPSELTKESLKISLEKEPLSNTIFQILPYFKYKMEGEKVYY
jgi:hypothetical protein